MKTEKRACCFFGHRKVAGKYELKERLTKIIENLIVNEKIDTFYVGSRSEFDDLCRQVLAVKKEKYPHIQRIYVRGEYPYINEDYKNHLLKHFEKTYFPEKAIKAGKAVYVERNCEMIDNSDICVVYFKDDYLPPRRKNSSRDITHYQAKSGTGIAYKYAVQKKRTIINVLDEI